MTSVKEYVLAQAPCPVEEENLFIPSSFSESDRTALALSDLVRDEAVLREAHAYECVMQLRLVLKAISVLYKKRKMNFVGQRNITRARARIQLTETIRDHHLLVYNESRDALIKLGALLPEEERLPQLRPEDLVRKSTVDKRQTGDTYHPDGKFWTIRIKPSFSRGINGKHIYLARRF